MIKNNLSVFMLMARSSIYKFLVLLFLMIVGECAAFYFTLDREIYYARELGTMINGLDSIFNNSMILYIFAAAFILLVVLLSLTNCHFSSNQGYTLRRLSISEKMVFVWHAIYNSICFFIFWAVQIFIAFGLCLLYIRIVNDPNQSGQTIFLSFYRQKFLHCLLPLKEVSIFIRNTFIVLGLGIATAWFPYLQRRGKVALSSIQIVLISALFFYREMGSFSSDLFVCLMLLSYCSYIIWHIICEEK